MRSDYLRIAGAALLFFLPFLGAVHLFDWNEAGLAESAREMLVTGDYVHPQLDFSPDWEHPPFFLWMQALAMALFGVGEFAARFPSAVAGLITLGLAYHLGRQLHDRSFGWIWALAWLGSLVPYLFFRSGLADPWFNLLVFLSLYGFIEFRWLFFTRFEGRNFWLRYRYLILGGLALGLAVLTKGISAYMIALVTLLAYFARYRFRNKGFLQHLMTFFGAAIIFPAIWLGLDGMAHGTSYIRNFLVNQSLFATSDFSVWGALLPIFLLIIGSFPISIFALPNLWGDRQPQDELLESDTLASCIRSDMATWMQLFFWSTLIIGWLTGTLAQFFSLAVFPLSYLGALTIWRAIRWNVYPQPVPWLLPLLGMVIGFTGMAIPFIGKHPHWLQPFFEHQPYMQHRLQIPADWPWWLGIPGAILVVGTLAVWWFWRKRQPWQAAQAAFTSGAIFVALTGMFLVPKIEQYVQYSTIEFYESKAGEDCVIFPVGFDGHAHLFYTRKLPAEPRLPTFDSPAEYPNRLRKKVYWIARVPDIPHLKALPSCRELYRKDGVAYFEQPAR